MMLLYDNPVSGNCYKVRLLFSQLGIEYERREVDVFDRSGREEVLGEVNPALRVPALVLDDGRTLAESNAIIFHFAEGTEFLPEDSYERAQVLQWLFFEQYSHEPAIAVLRFFRLANLDVDEREVGWRERAGAKALRAMDRHLTDRPFLVAGRYTIADIALYAYTHVAGEAGFELEQYPAIGAWLRRVSSQPGHVPITG